MFADSAFYDDPQHKYPTVEEQIKLARKVALSVLAPANLNSRGHKMFVKRRERSNKWSHGPADDDEAMTPETGGDPADAKFYQSDPWKSKQEGWDPNAPSPDVSRPPPLPITAMVFAPKLPSGEQMDKERLDALSHEELERVRLLERKSTHTNVAPQVCFNLADDLKNMKGKGGALFAKRQAKSESWGNKDDASALEECESPSVMTVDKDVLRKLNIEHIAKSSPTAVEVDVKVEEPHRLPVNRLKEMMDMPKPAMTPWEAVAEYGSVDKAFAHLDRHMSSPTSSSTSSHTGTSPHIAAAPSTYQRPLSKSILEGVKLKSSTGSPRPGRPTSAIEPANLNRDHQEIDMSKRADVIRCVGGDPNASGSLNTGGVLAAYLI